jgi:hypothetical protein
MCVVRQLCVTALAAVALAAPLIAQSGGLETGDFHRAAAAPEVVAAAQLMMRHGEMPLNDPLVLLEGVLDRVAKKLNTTIRIPRPVVLRGTECGKVNAFYSSSPYPTVTVCHELARTFDRTIRASGPSVPVVTVGLGFDLVVRHEVGHAIIDVLGLPILGREEDVADQFAFWSLVTDTTESFDIKLRAVAALGGAIVTTTMGDWNVGAALAGTHELGLQRAANFDCWLNGYAAVIGHDAPFPDEVPSRNVAECRAEYERLASSWRRLLGSHLIRSTTTVEPPRSTITVDAPRLPTTVLQSQGPVGTARSTLPEVWEVTIRPRLLSGPGADGHLQVSGKSSQSGFSEASFVINADGSVGNVEVLNPPSQDVAAATLAAVARRRYSPALMGGAPVPVHYKQLFVFP